VARTEGDHHGDDCGIADLDLADPATASGLSGMLCDVIKTPARLADGRDLFYFDASPQPGRGAADRRPLAAGRPVSELRYDPFQGSWVIYASHRQDRSYLPDATDCPLCPSRPGHPTEIPAGDYQVAVFENRFPSLTAASGPDAAVAGPPGGVLERRGAGGRCEVICYTADHDASFADLSPDRVALVLDALADRTAALAALPGVEQVYCFENRGREIGVTQPHPHGQIYAYPFVTPRTDRALALALAHRARTGRNLYDDALAAELRSQQRIVVAAEHWTAFVPHAARWPYEVHLYPNARVPDLASLESAARVELPAVLLDVFGRFSRLFDVPVPYIGGWHQAPVRHGRDELALHLELFTSRRTGDKLKFLAGSESGMDVFANDVLPEVAAERLRMAGNVSRPPSPSSAGEAHG
jgi:UDPglucose--hexose-1-phosphate uridylyltransferase